MQKKLAIKLLSKESKMSYNLLGDVNDSTNEIFYEEPDKTTVIFNVKDNILKRDNNDIYMEYNFNEPSNSKILLKEFDREIVPSIKVKKITTKAKSILVIYELNNEEYKYSIRIEE